MINIYKENVVCCIIYIYISNSFPQDILAIPIQWYEMGMEPDMLAMYIYNDDIMGI